MNREIFLSLAMWSQAYLAQFLGYSAVDTVNDLQKNFRPVSMVPGYAIVCCAWILPSWRVLRVDWLLATV